MRSFQFGVLLAATLLAQGLVQAALPEIVMTAERIELGDMSITSVSGRLAADGRLEVTGEALELAAWSEPVESLSLLCPQWSAAGAGYCANGEWSFVMGGLRSDHGASRISGMIDGIDLAGDSVALNGRVALEGLRAGITVQSFSDRLQVQLEWIDQPLKSLQAFAMSPPQMMWLSRGSSDGSIELLLPESGEPLLDYDFRLTDLSFDSPEGRFAGEGLQLSSLGSLRLGEAYAAEITGQVSSGELLLDDFYRDFADAAMDFGVKPGWAGPLVIFDEILLTDHTAFNLQGRAEFDPGAGENPLSFTVSNLELDFPGAYHRYVEPIATIFTLDGLEVTGGVRWSGEWENGVFESGELRVDDLTIVDLQRDRFAVTGLEARMRPGDHDFESSLNWRGLLLGPVNLGPATLKLDSAPGRVALTQELSLDVLGGQLIFEQFAIDLPRRFDRLEQDLDIALRARMQSMDMELLTKAMDWPAFSGDISGVIPAVSFDDGVLSVDGEIRFDVFDGSIALSELRVERPFGVLPSLAANIEIYDLDLEQVTNTFSFGQIGGRLDGYLKDLRMLDWEPVAFDAWLGTPARQSDSRGISRQAVNKLTTLGGGQATTVLTGPIMKMFNNFSYRRLGLGCRLQNNVCLLRGISEDEGSVLIMEGAGIPKIMIRAFNRRLDFQQLIAGLTAVSGDEQIRIGD